MDSILLKQAAFFSVLVVALTVVATPALAANQTVQTVDIAFMPSAVAVKPGETVTWNHPQTGEPHDVRFADFSYPDDGPLAAPRAPTLAPFTVARTFTTAASTPYRYYCEEHGDPGGGGMSGVVFVNAAGTLPPGAPAASFTVSQNPVTGQAVIFNGAGSSDPSPGGSVVKYEWDLDGNGAYETTTNSNPTVPAKYDTPGTRTVRLRVTDDQGLTGETERTFSVAAPASSTPPPPPTAGPTTQPVSLKIKLLSSKRLRQVLRRGLRFEAGVPSNGATLRATLSIRGRALGTLRRTNLSRGRVKLTIKLSRRGKRSLKKSLAKRRRTAALMKVTTGTKNARAHITLTR